MHQKLNRILVVDGSEVARTVIVRILNEEMPDTETVACGSFDAACRLLDDTGFDLITTSLMLPDADGLELCRRIRDSRRHHYTPTVVVSGDADSRLLREGFAAGVTDYFDKSLGYRAFAEFIKAFLQRNSGLVGRILYVEDSRTTAMQLTRLMAHHGLQVVHTTQAEEALELLRTAGPDAGDDRDPFDVVITDFYLQGRLTGGDLLHAIRARFHYSRQEMPVLVLTGAEADDKQAEVFHAGANDFVSKPVVEEVLMARIRSLLLIRQQFAALKRQSEHLQRLATTDSLTRVHNRRYLLDHGDRFLASRHHQPVAAVLMDIDHFKKINDIHGHITGDRVLEALGDLLLQRLPRDALAVRFGGEEFALLVPRCSLHDARRCAEGLRLEIEALQPAGVPVTVSIGVANNQLAAGMRLTELISEADRALYAAKAQGRNRVCA